MRRFYSRKQWADHVDGRAIGQLRLLVQRGLWDRRPPVPVDHVLEHGLDLRVSYEDVVEPAGRAIFGCLRPQTRTVVLNTVHAHLFEEVPGLENFTKAHEAGHADLYGLADQATKQMSVVNLGTYAPWRGQATRGEVQALFVMQLGTALRGQGRDVRTDVYRALHDQEQRRYRAGEDTPFERRTVDRYATGLLMPEDLIRSIVGARLIARWADVAELAELFRVSREAMTYRLRELRLAAPPVAEISPVRVGQGELF